MFNRCVPNRKLVGEKNEMAIIILQRLQRSIISSKKQNKNKNKKKKKQNKTKRTVQKKKILEEFFIQNTVHITNLHLL